MLSSHLKLNPQLEFVICVGLDLGTVKCVSDFGKVRFPSLHTSKIMSDFSTRNSSVLEFVGWDTVKRMGQKNFLVIPPIKKGRSHKRYLYSLGLLFSEAIKKTLVQNKTISASDEISLTIVLSYRGKTDVVFLKKSIQKTINPKILKIVPRVFVTLIDVDMDGELVINISQGTTKFVVFEKIMPIDGKSVLTVSSIIIGGISEFSYLNTDELHNHKSLCKRFAKPLVESMYNLIIYYVDEYKKDSIILAVGCMMILGVKKNMVENLENYTVKIHVDPNYSNTNGLYEFVKTMAIKQ